MRFLVLLAAITICLLCSSDTTARSLPDSSRHTQVPMAAAPTYCNAMHNVGKLKMTVTNFGMLTTDLVFGSASVDYFTGETLTACEYPKGAGNRYGFAASLWVGGIVGEDTLVSVGFDGWLNVREMNPGDGIFNPQAVLSTRSTLDPDSPEFEFAVSEQDILSQYHDTCRLGCPNLGNDEIDGRGHRPLNITINQQSYSWSQDSMDDFVLFNCSIRNIGSESIEKAYIGLYVDADVHGSADESGGSDDISGFRTLTTTVQPDGCTGSQAIPLPLAWIADNDGGYSGATRCRGITGVAILQAQFESQATAFNWWVSNGRAALDFGPRIKVNERNFGTGGTGTPAGDRNKYFLMSNGEIDYDQVFTNSITSTDAIWEYPTNRTFASAISRGSDARYLISIGPFDLAPNEEAPFVFAYVAGENLHQTANNVYNLPDNPQAYIAGLDFTDFDQNARTAAHVYDVPGLDTDQDGYAGSFEICQGDTVYSSGDGVPDFLPVAGCGVARTGNIDGDHIDGVNLADLSLLIAFMTMQSVRIGCLSEANVNSRDAIDLSDLSTLISYLTVPGSVELPWCK